MNLAFKNISLAEMAKWRAWVSLLIMDIPEKDFLSIPEVAFYPTLIDSIQDNVRTELLVNDEMAADYYKRKVWAYAILINGHVYKDGTKIVLCVDRGKKIQPNMPIEYIFYHEVGHFHIVNERKPNVFVTRDDEHGANLYGLTCYLNLLRKYPAFKTYSGTREAQESEDQFREFMNHFKDKPSEFVAKKLITEVLGWDKIT